MIVFLLLSDLKELCYLANGQPQAKEHIIFLSPSLLNELHLLAKGSLWNKEHICTDSEVRLGDELLRKASRG